MVLPKRPRSETSWPFARGHSRSLVSWALSAVLAVVRPVPERRPPALRAALAYGLNALTILSTFFFVRARRRLPAYAAALRWPVPSSRTPRPKRSRRGTTGYPIGDAFNALAITSVGASTLGQLRPETAVTALIGQAGTAGGRPLRCH